MPRRAGRTTRVSRSLLLCLPVVWAVLCGSGSAEPQPPIPPSPFTTLAVLSPDLLLQQVLARNPSLAQMQAAWQAATARYPQVTSLDDPMFGTTIAPASIGSRDVEFGYRVEISQKYPFPGKRQLRGQNALAEASAAGHDLDDMRLQLAENTRQAFADYYLAVRTLAENAQAVRLLQELRQEAQQRYEKVRDANQQDVLQAEVEIGRQQQQQLTLERMRAVAIARINTLLHLPPDLPLPLPPANLSYTAALPDAAALRAAAVRHRPDLQALADHIKAEEASLGLARKESCPDIEVTAAYDTIMGNGPTRDLAPQLGMRINLPVRTARRDAAITEAAARLAQRRAELDRQLDQVQLQVQEAYEQVRESERTVRLYEERILRAAQSNVEAARSAYVSGRVPFVSLLEAQRNLLELRQRYHEAVADSVRRRATLARVVGELIE